MIRRSSNIVRNFRSISLFVNKCKQNERTGSFTPVYKFPYIVPFSIVNRLKIYQTAIAAASIPSAAILNQFNYISGEAVYFTTSFGISGCLTLYGLGYLTNKFVGFIYYNEENDTVKISYIDFWGKRKDIEVPAKDVVPINELPSTPFDGLFLILRRFSTKETLRLNLRFGVILDKEKIKKVL